MSDLLQRAVEAQGGLAAWEDAERLEVMIAARGLAFTSRMRPTGLRRTRATVETKAQRVRFHSYAGEGIAGVFDGEGDRVWIEGRDGTRRAGRDHPRRAFFGLRGARRKLRWDALDFLYFCGYALWNYLNVPFVLNQEGFELARLAPANDRGVPCDRLGIRFPDRIHTHSPEQTLWLNSNGLITRLDYTADILGGYAKAANTVRERGPIGDLLLPTRRLVLPARGLRVLPRPKLVRVAIDAA